ncbi:VWA domain-containing protein [Thalassococcus sp. S3]|uniref:vWA domain-containing protein n=1 Tax=Thalassococcus sp. S3 TaxID=2017482 RepID=UPI0010240F23|nr:VWA domain-containing protein [Thalassococcus sp. S3]QBF31770.1 hypothetical protein CFI11_11130 [Thalassococcus sp. S3]
MRGILLAGCLAGLSLQIQAQETPRVIPQGGAEGAEVTISEVNHDDYPQVRLFVSVLRDGSPVTGLTAADFRVREDEVDQDPLTVEPQLPPISVVVTLDTSGSMARSLDETRAAASAFVSALGPTDAVQLVSFARTVQIQTPMMSAKDPILSAIAGLGARGDTALYDALYQSIDLLADRRGRKAVVLLSDGVDDDGQGQPLSSRTIADVLARAETVGVPVFVVGLGTELDEAVLTDIATTTGAAYLPAPTAEELSAVYAQIADRLSGQYSIRYTSSLPADGIARRIDLNALGQQASRSYTPEGTAAPAAATPPSPAAPTLQSDACPTATALTEEQPVLEQSASRYQQNLISASDRNQSRDDVMRRLQTAFGDAPVLSYTCARTTLEQMSQLYGGNLITASQRNDLRDIVTDSTMLRCRAAGVEPEVTECLTNAMSLYSANLVTATQRNAMRDIAFDQLMAVYLQAPAFEDQMARIGELYQQRLITATQRNRARDALLAAE